MVLRRQGTLFELPDESAQSRRLHRELRTFSEFGTDTAVTSTLGLCDQRQHLVPTYVNEFWTGRQRMACRLHEISYRACFKPQLPRFFIERLTEVGEAVYDPFMGRGTTLLEAALCGRRPLGCDVNPLSRMLLAPRLAPPDTAAVEARLGELSFDRDLPLPEDLLVFYHPETLRELVSLRTGLLELQAGAGRLDPVDDWIRMVAVNRLTGHSPGFFSVYTLPPNQAVSVESQKRINRKRDQTPPRRSVPDLILKKTRRLLGGWTDEDREQLRRSASDAVLVTGRADHTPQVAADSVALVVTSPPFLDVVQYAVDNWLRCWFCGIDADAVDMTIKRNVAEWQAEMTAVFGELARVVRPGGHVAFEVGEVKQATVRLEEAVLPCGVAAGLEPELVLVNSQDFTKTSNCWGIHNNTLGTNSNRIVLFRKPTR